MRYWFLKFLNLWGNAAFRKDRDYTKVTAVYDPRTQITAMISTVPVIRTIYSPGSLIVIRVDWSKT